MKKCSRCEQLKSESKFPKDPRTKNGLASECQSCRNIYQQIWRSRNRAKIRKYSEKSREKHKEKIWKYQNTKQYRERHRQYMKEYNKTERWKKYRRKWENSNRRENPKCRIDDSMSKSIREALKGEKAGLKWEKLVSYSLEDLIKHLEVQFDDKMCWENYGSYWEIDHIIPKSWYIYTKPEDIGFKMCWALENLQPLEKIANKKKGNRY